MLGKFAKFRPVAKMSDKVFCLFARVWSRGINLQLGKPYSANVLRHNMEQIFGELPPNHIPHHIVPKTSPAMTKLQQFGIDPNSPSNGVALPKNAAAGDYSSAHGGRHCKKYYDFVETVVMGANDKEEAINALAAIRQDLLSGALVVQGCE
ncbi:AHH domain-containing protein [Chitinimonas lacunae]|uniref:AHH domain-containing protein n=1 Tax=Chitinimonas lacunae TaxID=1963018 RepID=A0ABV8MTS2_9NEIS